MKILSNNENLLKGTMEYPSVFIDHPYPEYLPVLVNSLNKDEYNSVPILVLNKEGQRIKLKARVNFTPNELKKLLRIYSLQVIYSETESVKISNVRDLLEGIRWI